MPTNNSESSWYAVRCLFEHPDRTNLGEKHLYEEKITLWRAASPQEAEEKAKTEGVAYSKSESCVFLRLSDTFHLFDEMIQEGTEVFSIMRGSNLDTDLYQKTFCCTPSDRASSAPPFGMKNG